MIIHHLAVDGVSWRILLEDLNIAWAQHHSGQPVALPAGGTSFARWASAAGEYARRPEVVGQAEAWRQVAATPAALPAVRPAVDTYRHAPGTCRCRWMSRRPACCSVRCRRRFMPGCNDILLIAFGVGVARVFGHRQRADRHRRRGPRAPRGAGRRCGLVAHGGVVYHQVPGGVERRWAALGAGAGRRGRRWGR